MTSTKLAPRKKVAFFKDGDLNFSGVNLTVTKSKYQSIDALYTDLNDRIKLPFGVRAIYTPTNNSNNNKIFTQRRRTKIWIFIAKGNTDNRSIFVLSPKVKDFQEVLKDASQTLRLQEGPVTALLTLDGKQVYFASSINVFAMYKVGWNAKFVFAIYVFSEKNKHPANTYLFRVVNRNTRKRCEISSAELRIKTRQLRHLSSVIFYCWLWIGNVCLVAKRFRIEKILKENLNISILHE